MPSWDIFLAHASPDENHALRLYRLLAPHARTFLDTESVPLGADTRITIGRELRATPLIVVLLSANSEAAHWQSGEISVSVELARTHKATVIPIWVDRLPDPTLVGAEGLFQLRGLSLKHLEDAQVATEILKTLATIRTTRAASDSPAVTRYLTEARLAWAELAVPGFQGRDKVRFALDDVYVELRQVRAEPASRGSKASADKRSGGERSDEAKERPPALSLLQMVADAEKGKDPRGFVILGAPGSGKTTLLRHLFVRIAREGSAALGFPTGLLPVYIRCARFDPTVDFVPQGLAAALPRILAEDGWGDAARALVASDPRPVLFLLDGLDEVSNTTTRTNLCDWIEKERVRWPHARFLVTCRVAAWSQHEGARLSNLFPVFEVEALGDEQVAAYAERWYRAVYEGLGRANADERARKLTSRLLRVRDAGSIRLRQMAGNPLLLYSICLVHHEDDELPDRRAKLYDRCVSLLLEHWAKQRAGAVLLSESKARAVLQPLAFQMHADQLERIDGAALLATIADRLDDVDAGLSAAEFLVCIRDTCGLLTGEAEDSYRFFHLSFQEYLAARHAADHVGVLVAHLGESWWREVTLLALADEGTATRFLRALLDTQGWEQHAELVRGCLDEVDGVDTGVVRERLRSIAAGPPRAEDGPILTALLLLVRGRKGEALARAVEPLTGHPDGVVRRLATEARWRVSAPSVPVEGADWIEPVTRMEFVWVPPGEFWMGATKEEGHACFDDEADEDEGPPRRVRISTGLWMGRYTVTNRQYRVYVEDADAPASAAWLDPALTHPSQPVTHVSVEDAEGFCGWLNARVIDAGARRIQLPTEAQWEYAARGAGEEHASPRKYPWGADTPTARHAQFGRSFEDPTRLGITGGRPAGAGPFGAEDQAGNVWEWCRDGWTDPFGDQVSRRLVDPWHAPLGDVPRVVRGGAWFDSSEGLRSASRLGPDPQGRGGNLGFRVVLSRPRR